MSFKGGENVNDFVFLNISFFAFSSVPLEQELSKSHESVFREPSAEMAMLTIGLKVRAGCDFIPNVLGFSLFEWS